VAGSDPTPMSRYRGVSGVSGASRNSLSACPCKATSSQLFMARTHLKILLTLNQFPSSFRLLILSMRMALKQVSPRERGQGHTWTLLFAARRTVAASAERQRGGGRCQMQNPCHGCAGSLTS